jgi:hypothetical protein
MQEPAGKTPDDGSGDTGRSAEYLQHSRIDISLSNHYNQEMASSLILD